MRILGWMHRKLRQNSSDIFKDFASVGSCNCLSGRPSLEEEHHHHRNPNPRSVRSGIGGDEAIADGFLDGILSIGTLGSVPIESNDPETEQNGDEDGPPTPAFGGGGGGDLVDEIAEKNAEATTESDLMLVSAELEKVLAAEDHRLSSARLSHISDKSAIDACPLQGYLFGSPIQIAANNAAKAAEVERRASLGELLMKSRVAEEEEEDEDEEEEEEEATVGGFSAGGGGVGGSPASVNLLVKRLLKRFGSARFRSSGGPLDKNPAAESKFQKILQLFHRKVHPENTVASKKSFTLDKSETKATTLLTGTSDSSSYGVSDTILTSIGGCKKEFIPSYKFYSNPQILTLIGGEPSGNNEYWIKTDADYLVLEL